MGYEQAQGTLCGGYSFQNLQTSDSMNGDW